MSDELYEGKIKTYQEIYRESAVTFLRLVLMCFVSARVLSVLVPSTIHRSLPTLWQLTLSRRRHCMYMYCRCFRFVICIQSLAVCHPARRRRVMRRSESMCAFQFAKNNFDSIRFDSHQKIDSNRFQSIQFGRSTLYY